MSVIDLFMKGNKVFLEIFFVGLDMFKEIVLYANSNMEY